jgi:hypothetical protein
MANKGEEWRPGSFTKNFGWGNEAHSLIELHASIKRGFDGVMKDVPREQFRQRIKQLGYIDYIPMNFFLFNKRVNGKDYLIADELVFQALAAEHSPQFDKLALFIFNFSYAGAWRGAQSYQRRPALWAYHYIKDQVAGRFNWNTGLVNADDIERFVAADPRYKGETARKLATNLNFLYSIGRLRELAERRVERWWADALFLALDRLIEDRELDGLKTSASQYAGLLSQTGFHTISGRRSVEKDLATAHLVALYAACGSRERFLEDQVKERTARTLGEEQCLAPNDCRPQGAVHPTNPHILKIIPRACAALARHAGFRLVDADELADFDAEGFIREQVDNALNSLREQKVLPTMSAEELMKITRER